MATKQKRTLPRLGSVLVKACDIRRRNMDAAEFKVPGKVDQNEETPTYA